MKLSDVASSMRRDSCRLKHSLVHERSVTTQPSGGSAEKGATADCQQPTDRRTAHFVGGWDNRDWDELKFDLAQLQQALNAKTSNALDLESTPATNVIVIDRAHRRSGQASLRPEFRTARSGAVANAAEQSPLKPTSSQERAAAEVRGGERVGFSIATPSR